MTERQAFALFVATVARAAEDLRTYTQPHSLARMYAGETLAEAQRLQTLLTNITKEES
jgi:hypothetical protein